MNAWLVLICVGAGTYVFRAAMFVVLGGRSLPAWTDRPLSFVGTAAIAAIVSGMLLTSHGRFDAAGVAELAAVGAGILAARRTANVAMAMFVGFPVLWGLSALGL